MRPVRLAAPRSKYGVRLDDAGKAARTVDGRLFASQREAARYAELRLLERTGAIGGLTCQPVFPLAVNGVPLGRCLLDFGYRTPAGATVFEDAKGRDTPLSRWKRRHVEAQYGIEVRIT